MRSLIKHVRKDKDTVKVLHIGEYVQGGVATYIKSLLHHPDRPDIIDYLLCSEKKSDHKWPLPVEQITYYSYTRNLYNLPKAMYSIMKQIRILQPDVIYCHSTWAGLLVRFPMLFFGKPCRILYNAHGWAFLRDVAKWKRRLYAIIERILLFSTDMVINVSNYEYQAALKYGLSNIKQKVIYSGIPSEKGKIDSEVQLPHEKLNLLFVGRFDPQKGIDYFLHVFSKVKRSDLHLTVIGDNVIGGGTYIEKKDTECVTFLGWVPHDKLASYYNACDVVIMPSRWEAFGLVAIEAMKYGKAVIVSNRGALPEIVQDGRNGYIFNFNQPEQLQQILQNLSLHKLRCFSHINKSDFLMKYQDTLLKKETYKLYEPEREI